MVQIKWCWFHSKIFIFGQVMATFGQTFFGHNSLIFWADWELRKLLSVDSWWEIQIMMLIFRFRFFGPILVGKWQWRPHAPLIVCGLQTRPKSSPTGGTFGPTTISKSCFRYFQGWTTPPPLKSLARVETCKSSSIQFTV